jgi:hypothetical protein
MAACSADTQDDFQDADEAFDGGEGLVDARCSVHDLG